VPLSRLVFCFILALPTLHGADDSTASALRPVIYAKDEDAAMAMKAAQIVALVEISEVELTGDMRLVDKPPEMGGPMVPVITLYLARIHARNVLALRGLDDKEFEFYSWVWASGTHGGPRLFHPLPGTFHVIFLRREASYLHTVGDYPSYDLELHSSLVQSTIAEWRSTSTAGEDPLLRLITARLRAEFGHTTETGFHARDLPDLVSLAGPLLVATELDSLCRHSTSSTGRAAACLVTAEEFPGRCEAYRLAKLASPEGFTEHKVARDIANCALRNQEYIKELRPDNVPVRWFYGRASSAENLRDAIRVYASGMDREVRVAACQVASNMPEAQGIPECAAR
jgi:hypothetical protein